jgi:hypothetical protein
MPFYEKGDVRIHYEEVGSGFPGMIIPGGGLNSTAAGLATHPFNPPKQYEGLEASALRPPGRHHDGDGARFSHQHVHKARRLRLHRDA